MPTVATDFSQKIREWDDLGDWQKIATFIKAG